VIYGDSHAGHLLAGLENWARKADNVVSLIPIANTACPPLPNVVPLIAGYRKPECESGNAAVMDDISGMMAAHDPAAGKVLAVVLAARWTVYLGASNISVYEPWRGYVDYRAEGSRAAEDMVSDRLRTVIDKFSQRSVRTVIVLSPPELRFPIGKCTERLAASRCATAREVHDAHTAAIRRIVHKLEAEYPDTVRVFDPTPIFCSEVTCVVTGTGGHLYSDSNHLSEMGSQITADALAPVLRWAVQLESSGAQILTTNQ
jgi:hypothetical protein